MAFLPRSTCLLISWLHSPSAVILEPPKVKSVTVSIVYPSICHGVMGPDAMILVFWMLSFKPTCDPQVGSNKIFHFFLRWTVDDAFFFFIHWGKIWRGAASAVFSLALFFCSLGTWPFSPSCPPLSQWMTRIFIREDPGRWIPHRCLHVCCELELQLSFNLS